ncbi:hypothetical protein M501DRAFT_362147 [Patellaria atrata CBS 101060]|uniref:Uncharacterized protein n=1 Tax=Patellaria atrata CBS 101060 TaxID=1346257 RepID=A0A9P4VVR4_9PEZI|nr:hypothetical protein M501DRAFT_362147 [Patellaria atrata CBS 101060]
MSSGTGIESSVRLQPSIALTATDDPGLTDHTVRRIIVQHNELQVKTVRCRGQKPTLKPTKELVNEHLLYLRQADSNTSVMNEVNLLEAAYSASIKRLNTLAKLSISDLKIGSHHTGGVLIGKNLVDASNGATRRTIIQDSCGDAIRLHLCNYGPKGPHDPRLILKDTIIAIKDPYYIFITKDKAAVKVDHPSNLIVLPAFGHHVPSIWKKDLSADPTEMNAIADSFDNEVPKDSRTIGRLYDLFDW